jgi:O-antigen/teichoic acid export membrane protein
VLVKELNKPDADESRVVGNLLGLRWASAALVLGAGAMIIFFFPYSSAVKEAVWIGTGSYIAIAATQLLVGIFQTKLAMHRVMFAEVTGRIVLLVATMIVIAKHGGLNSIMTVVVASSLINFIMVWLSARAWVRLKPRFEWVYWKALLHDSWPIAISIILNLVYFRIDTIFLSFFASQYTVGLYGASYKILEILNSFPIMFVGLLIPLLGRAFAESNNDRFRTIFQRGFETTLLLALMVVVPGWIFAPKILELIGGAAYVPGAPALRLLLIAVFALFLNSLSGHTITMINKQRMMVWGYLSVAIIGVASYLILIPLFSMIGAAIGTILTETLSGVIGYVVVMRTMKFRFAAGPIVKILLAGAIMAAVAIVTKGFGWIPAVIISWAVFAGTLLATKTIPLQEIRTIVGSRIGLNTQLPPE